MSHEQLKEIVERATVDKAFRAQLLENTEETLAQNRWVLSDKEKEALFTLKEDSGQSPDRTLDERVSKALYGTETHSILW